MVDVKLFTAMDKFGASMTVAGMVVSVAIDAVGIFLVGAVSSVVTLYTGTVDFVVSFAVVG